MKENKYDDKIFFEKYSEMSRSKVVVTKDAVASIEEVYA